MEKFSRFIFISLAVNALLFAGCREERTKVTDKILQLDSGGIVKTLDPALASDLSSRNMAGAIFDTLLQYDYLARPYRLIPSMLAKMPEVSADGKTYTFTLRDDLYFQVDPCFPDKAARKVTADDVIFSFQRILDPAMHSPVFWMFRDKLTGVNEFRKKLSAKSLADSSRYAVGCSGLEKVGELVFKMHLESPDPRFLFNFAIPYTGIVSEKAAEFYQGNLADHPIGSGPFRLSDWRKEYRMTLERHRDYREEYYPEAANVADRTRRLPLADKVIYHTVKQPFTSWLLFLQGELDMTALDKDNLDLVSGEGGKLSPSLASRDIRLIRAPIFEVRYIGFNFQDPILGNNENLRKAISLAFDVQRRVEHSSFQLIAAKGPIPPGVDGYSELLENPYAGQNIALAKEYLVKAGYPDGIDPATGEALTLTFDQNGNSAAVRQQGEMMVSDLAQIGIKVVPVLNNGPRFFAKLRQGEMQLFRLSWVGDYPDAENFLQLFYSNNAGGANRVHFRDAKFDRMFEAVMPMAESPERTMRYQEMAAYLVEKAPWIFESYPVSYQLSHGFLENYVPHDFPFAQLKYLTLDPVRRERAKKSFKPLNFKELRK